MKFINLERDLEKSGSLIFMTYNPYESRMFDRVEKDGFMPFIYELEDDEMSNERITIRAMGKFVSINDNKYVSKVNPENNTQDVLSVLEAYFNTKAKTEVVHLSDVKAALGVPVNANAADFVFIPGQGWEKMPMPDETIIKPDPNTADDIKKKRNEFYNIGCNEFDYKYPIRECVIAKARKIISGERQGQYGKPEDNFKKIADMWSTYLGTEIKSSDVAAMMVLMKTARISGGVYKDDNWVDIIGYAALGAEIQAMEEEDDI